jgi:hypothetical protein
VRYEKRQNDHAQKAGDGAQEAFPNESHDGFACVYP